jgi:hypothetical protein
MGAQSAFQKIANVRKGRESVDPKIAGNFRLSAEAARNIASVK